VKTSHVAPRESWIEKHQVRLLKYGVVAAFVLMIAGGFYVSYLLFSLSARTEEQARVVESLAENLDTSRKQLQNNGITPSAPPAKDVVKQVEGQPGAKGDPGNEGPPGPTGPSGPSGPRGPKGDTGEQGKTGQEGTPGVAGEVGPSGAPGVNGADGTDGTNGADGTNGVDGAVGPQGPAGPTGPQGPPGPQGEVGPQGEAGATGTLPGTMKINHATGTSETCTLRDGNTYDCVADTPAPPTTPPTTLKKTRTSGTSSPSEPGQQNPMTMSYLYAIVDRKRSS